MSADTRHQASAVLAAFRYQLLQSLSAWLDLQPNEVLWLEVSEDFSKVSESEGTAVQVKSSPKPLTLRSADVADALRRFWTRSAAGTDQRSRLVFISRGTAGHEQGFSFPNGQPGLLYWMAARLDADTTPLREFLTTLFSGEPLGGWLALNPSDEELRTKLLRRVDWTMSAPESAALEDEVRERVRFVLHGEGVPVSAADDATRMLLQRVFDTACNGDPAKRRLTRFDLSDVAERLLRPGQLAFIKAVAIQDRGSSLGGWVTTLTAPSAGIIRRSATVLSITTAASGESILWLNGASGVGKSTLATLIASEYGGEWLCLDLRPAQDDRRAATAAWHQLAWALDEDPSVSGVVIDDCNNQAFEALRSRLSPLARALSGRGARLIVTSSHSLPPARQGEMGVSQRAMCVAPYFTVDELRELITLPVGPSADMVEAWANLVSITTRGGHPQLAAAKVANLRDRGWPAEALTEDILGRPSEAVQLTREEARRRLLGEVPSRSSRELLRRVSCVFDRADDGLIRALAEDLPRIDEVGDSLAILRGSWIEVTNDNYLRISPLIADLGADATEEERRRWHQIGARHWITKGPLNERTLPLCFWSAFLGEEILVLAKVCEMLEALPKERVHSAAAVLSPVVALRTDRSILPNHAGIAPLMRLLQFTVADAIEDEVVAKAAAERLLIEIDECPIEELRALSTSIAAFKVVTADSTEIPAAVTLDYVLRAREVAPRVEALGARPPSDIPGDGGVAGFIFAFFTVRLRSSQRFKELIVAMDALNEGDRGWLLDAVSASLDGLGILFQSPWANEQLAGGDAQATLTRYENIAEITTKWRRADVTVEVACARSVILDEMIGDPARAIAAVDEAMTAVGLDWRLVQQKAKVLAHEERHDEALSLYTSVEGQIVGKGFDRAMAIRGAALSAAALSRFEEAARLIREARFALEGNSYFEAVSAGFLIDEALAQWRAGDRRTALLTTADALDAVKSIDPNVSRQNERAHQLARYIVGVFWDEVQPFPRSTPKLLQFGQASALAGDEALQNIDFKPLLDLWRLLAVVEAEAGIDAGLDQRSLARQNGPASSAMEMAIAEARYARALANDRDLSNVAGLGLAAVSAAATAIDLQKSGGVQRMKPQGRVCAHRLAELLSGNWRERVLSVLLDIVVWLGLRGELNGRTIESLGRACRANGIDEQIIDPMLKAASGLYSVPPDAADPIALSYLLSERFHPSESPRARFSRDFRLLSHTAVSAARLALERPVVAAITTGWRFVLKEQAFLLKNPSAHRDAIEAAIVVAESQGLRGLAPLLLAAAPAVSVEVGATWEEFLLRIGART